MNPTRIAAALRELADAIEDGAVEAPTMPQDAPVRRKPRTYPKPLAPPSEHALGAARRMLRRNGVGA